MSKDLSKAQSRNPAIRTTLIYKDSLDWKNVTLS